VFNILGVVTPEDDDGRLYPLMGDETSFVEHEERDAEGHEFVASRLELTEKIGRDGKARQIAFLRDDKSDVLITDCRVVVNCRNWDAGGGAFGMGLGATLAGIENVISKAKARKRRRGKMCLGHIRYEWLMGVGYEPKTKWTSTPTIRFVVWDGNGPETWRILYLNIVVSKALDPRALATEIVQRSARYWLSWADESAGVDEDRRQLFERLAADDLELPDPEPGTRYAMQMMPKCWVASPDKIFG
jgi:hypothetical protein